MHTTQRCLAWLLFLAIVVPGSALAERRARLVGRIVDPEGKPIQGVVVTVTSPQIPGFDEAKTTNKKGVFIVDFSQVGVTYVCKFESTGYQVLEVQQQWDLEGTEQFTWTLQPASTAGLADLHVASTSQPAVAAYNAGIRAFKAQDNATAEARFAEAVGHDPELIQAWGALSTVRLDLGKYREAVEAAERAIALGSTDEAVLTARWQAYRNLDDEVKAAEALADLERIGRRAEEAKRLHNEGVALTKAGDDAGAFAKFQEALGLDPTLEASLLGLAKAGVTIGRNAEAAAAAESVLKGDPRNEQAIRLRFNACLALGDKAKLIDALVGLAVVEPVAARDGLLQLAFEAYDVNDLPVAKERFIKVLAIDPSYPQAHYYLGVISVGEGAGAVAKSYLERFLQLAPNDPEAPAARDMLKFLAKP